MVLPTTQDLLSRNAEYSRTHKPTPLFEEIYGIGNRLPTVAVITCADPRCVPEKFLNADLMEVIVIRNAGSNVEEAMRSLIPIDEVVKLDEIMVIDHTDCGATYFRDHNLRAVLKKRAPGKAEQVDKMTFGEVTTSQQDHVRSGVQWLKDSPFLRAELKEGVKGYIYDITKGILERVHQ